jgi:hypothetical protein
MTSCWLINGPDFQAPSAAGQFAGLRGMRTFALDVIEGGLSELPARRGTVIAMRFAQFDRLPSIQRELLRSCVHRGATLYLRGGFQPGDRYTLRPFASGDFRVSVESHARGYYFTNSPILPRVLHDESVEGEFAIHGVETEERLVEPLLMMKRPDGAVRPCIFALLCGGGRVILDLHPDDTFPCTSIMSRMADPVALPANVGAMVAADLAAGRDLERPAAFNLVIDDRPANLDYFGAPNLTRFLSHLCRRCPWMHVDFGWTPNQTHPDPRYIEVLRQFDTGFAWHGLMRHVDHRTFDDYSAELAKGEVLVRNIIRRYRVAFQHIMIFPFEKSTPAAAAVVAHAGFLASVETVTESAEPDQNVPSYMCFSTAARITESPLPVLYRYSASSLSRNRLLALAMLGNPIIAAAHPADLSLKRFAGLVSRGGFQYFDTVLDFAAAKRLRARSLEEIAAEVSAARENGDSDYLAAPSALCTVP